MFFLVNTRYGTLEHLRYYCNVLRNDEFDPFGEEREACV